MTWAALLLVLVAEDGTGPVIAAAADTTGAYLAADTTRAYLATDTAGAYLDAGAAELVRRARERRVLVETSIRRYRAEVREAVSLGAAVGWRERTLAVCESAHRIDWERDGGVRVEVLGARFASPSLAPEPRVPRGAFPCSPAQRSRRGRDGERRWSAVQIGVVFDPAGDHLLLDNVLGEEEGFLRHPLEPGSEAHYRFGSGDTMTIRLPDGRVVRVIELRVQPRRGDYRLVSGVLWLDAGSHAVVRATYRLARPFDAELDLEGSDAEDIRFVPGFMKPIRAEFRYVTMEYGLWELRWWMPRIVALEGHFRIGGLRLPARYERVYDAYEVEGDAELVPGGAATPVVVVGDPPADTAGAAAGRPACPVQRCLCTDRVCRPLETVIADDETLLASPRLPPLRRPEARLVIDPVELEPLLAAIDRLPPAPWTLQPPRLVWGLTREGLTRYNRVEGFSVGVRAELDLGRVVVDATPRLGTGDRKPRLEIGADLLRPTFHYRLAGYHGLAAQDSVASPFGLGNSLAALVLGRDHGDYYEASGAAFAATRTLSHPAWIAWRVYAERQAPVAGTTRFSLRRRLGDAGHVFRENPEADRADQLGVGVWLGAARGRDPSSFRWDGELGLEAAAGSFDHLRGSARVRFGAPLPGDLVVSLEGAAGAVSSGAPAQALMAVGGPHSLRGFETATARGPAFWRSRIEFARPSPAARIVAFADAARAAELGRLGAARPFVSAGLGMGLLDGLVRLDAAAPIQPSGRWRIHLYLDGAL